MSNSRERATRLETLLPQILRTLYHADAEDGTFTHLTISQMRVMRILFLGPKSPSELGDELHQSPSATTQMVDRLVNLGLVERMEDREDRRVRHLSLSPKGLEFMKCRQQSRVAMAEGVLAKLSEDKQATLLGHLEELLEAAQMSRQGQKSPCESPELVAQMEGFLPPTTQPKGE